jgi:polar amino acid transport system substrate-binding protein
MALVFSPLLDASQAIAADVPTIRLCQDVEDVYPWSLHSRPGLNNILLGIVESKLEVSLTVSLLPWKRCQEALKNGLVDGVFAISYTPERLEFAVYPMKANAPDPTKRLMLESFSLYRRTGDTSVTWDGLHLKSSGRIGAQFGRSVVAQLQQLSALVDTGAYSAEDNLRKLMAGRVSAVALLTLQTDSVIVTHHEFAGKIEKLPIPLIEKPFYLVFSKQFAISHTRQMQEIWQEVERVRESPEYRVMEASFR